MAKANDAGRRAVAVTGLGAVSSIGIGATEFLAGLRAGRSGASTIESFDTTGFEHSRGGEVRGFAPEDWIERLEIDSLGRATQFAIAAAKMAVADGGLDPAELAAARSLVSVGTTDGESRDLDSLVAQEVEQGWAGLSPEIARRVPAGRLSSGVAAELGLTDVEVLTLPVACAAGNYAIGYGYDAVSYGDVDYAIVGGADAFCRKTFSGFYRLGTIAPEKCQPFDINRKGILTGEGAGMLLLEDLDRARARGATVYAVVLGYGMTCDALHPVAPDRGSVERCMRKAQQSAGVAASSIDYISAHGTGTRANDITEAAAIREVFGDDLPRTVSIKSMLGHTMGAASALAAVGCALSISHGFIPPTINHEETDPECGVDCVPNQSIETPVSVVQNNGLAFAGNNAVVVFGDEQVARAG
ncbi:beta-ketoacyl-[acyl-carrier-protein] synthase family protein [Nocardia sp. NPDC127579]|uniref:beta-ketoacyl-[acyl-carrier-protein] synthase family protein n=1 Tax=Nocardia sp. NPDC127579 TaxID=3345402 RepID=UPI003642884D